MSKQREALELALEALEQYGTSCLNHEDAYSAAIKTIREALAEPEREPTTDGELYAAFLIGLQSKKPAKKPLTDEQIDAEFDRETWVTVVFADGARGIALDKVTARDFARAIERAHGIGVKE